MTLSTATVSEQPENLSSRPTPSCPASEKKERVRLIRDGLVNYAGYASASLAGLVVVLIVIHTSAATGRLAPARPTHACAP